MMPEQRVERIKVQKLMMPKRNLILQISLLRQRAISKMLQIVMLERIKIQRLMILPIEPDN